MARNLVMDVPAAPAMAFKAYMYKEVLVRDYLLADSYAPYAAVLGGILMCKLVMSFTLVLFKPCDNSTSNRAITFLCSMLIGQKMC